MSNDEVERVRVEDHSCPGGGDCSGHGDKVAEDGPGVWVAFDCGLTTLVYEGDVEPVATDGGDAHPDPVDDVELSDDEVDHVGYVLWTHGAANALRARVTAELRGEAPPEWAVDHGAGDPVGDELATLADDLDEDTVTVPRDLLEAVVECADGDITPPPSVADRARAFVEDGGRHE